jgi:hypothetical protein
MLNLQSEEPGKAHLDGLSDATFGIIHSEGRPMGQLVAYEAQLTSAPLREWVGQIFFDGTNFRGSVVSTDSGAGEPVFSSPLYTEKEPNRCAQGPTN